MGTNLSKTDETGETKPDDKLQSRHMISSTYKQPLYLQRRLYNPTLSASFKAVDWPCDLFAHHSEGPINEMLQPQKRSGLIPDRFMTSSLVLSSGLRQPS
jgi:hypothetical protein